MQVPSCFRDFVACEGGSRTDAVGDLELDVLERGHAAEQDRGPLTGSSAQQMAGVDVERTLRAPFEILKNIHPGTSPTTGNGNGSYQSGVELHHPWKVPNPLKAKYRIGSGFGVAR
jgi:hypothetical protein